MINKTLSVILFSLMIFFSATAQNSRGYIVTVGQQAPNFEMELTDGTKMKLSDLRGRVVLLQFTASWCGVCTKEMPHIEKDIWKKYKDKGIFVVAIDRDEPLYLVKNYQKRSGVTYPFAIDPGANIFGLFASKKSGVTRNVLIDKNGKIVYLTRLFNKEEFDGLKRKISQLL